MKAPRLALALRAFVALTVALGASAAALSPSFAQATAPKLSAKLSSNRVEVGEIVTLELRATTQGDDAQPLQITLPPGLQKVGEARCKAAGARASSSSRGSSWP